MRMLLLTAIASCSLAASLTSATAFDPKSAIAGTITIATANDHCPRGTVPPEDVVVAIRVFSRLTGSSTMEAGLHLESLAKMNRESMDDEEFSRFCLTVLRASTT